MMVVRSRHNKQAGRQAGRQARNSSKQHVHTCVERLPNIAAAHRPDGRGKYISGHCSCFRHGSSYFLRDKRSNGWFALVAVEQDKSEKGRRKRRKKREGNGEGTQVQKNEKTVGGGAPLLSGTGTISFSLPPRFGSFINLQIRHQTGNRRGEQEAAMPVQRWLLL